MTEKKRKDRKVLMSTSCIPMASEGGSGVIMRLSISFQGFDKGFDAYQEQAFFFWGDLV